MILSFPVDSYSMASEVYKIGQTNYDMWTHQPTNDIVIRSNNDRLVKEGILVRYTEGELQYYDLVNPRFWYFGWWNRFKLETNNPLLKDLILFTHPQLGTCNIKVGWRKYTFDGRVSEEKFIPSNVPVNGITPKFEFSYSDPNLFWLVPKNLIHEEDFSGSLYSNETVSPGKCVWTGFKQEIGERAVKLVVSDGLVVENTGRYLRYWDLNTPCYMFEHKQLLSQTTTNWKLKCLMMRISGTKTGTHV
jgi:hypothetical protein